MSDVKRYVQNRAKRDPKFAENCDAGYADFKIGVILRQAREAAGLTQAEVAQKLRTKKSAISRIENHERVINVQNVRQGVKARKSVAFYQLRDSVVIRRIKDDHLR